MSRALPHWSPFKEMPYRLAFSPVYEAFLNWRSLLSFIPELVSNRHKPNQYKILWSNPHDFSKSSVQTGHSAPWQLRARSQNPGVLEWAPLVLRRKSAYLLQYKSLLSICCQKTKARRFADSLGFLKKPRSGNSEPDFYGTDWLQLRCVLCGGCGG